MTNLSSKDRIKIHLSDIDKVVENENLICLSDNECQYKGINVLESFDERYPSESFNHIKHISDVIHITKDLKILTSQLYLYLPYINNPMVEYKYFLEKKLFTYFQNNEDWIYSTYSSCCYEKLYNFWDRIGDRLSISFDTKLNTYQIGFHSVMDKLTQIEQIQSNEYFNNLKEYWKLDFNEFNKVRKKIVHYYQWETIYQDEFIRNSRNEERIRELWEWKKGLPSYFKNELKNCLEGFYNMVMLERSLK